MIKCNLTTKSKTGILYALAHHASAVRPAVLELYNTFFLTDVDGYYDSWRRNGRNSTFAAFLGKQYFFRLSDDAKCIEIRTRAHGLVKWRITTRADMLNWTRQVGLA